MTNKDATSGLIHPQGKELCKVQSTTTITQYGLKNIVECAHNKRIKKKTTAVNNVARLQQTPCYVVGVLLYVRMHYAFAASQKLDVIYDETLWIKNFCARAKLYIIENSSL
jgi:hypothetical protein